MATSGKTSNSKKRRSRAQRRRRNRAKGLDRKTEEGKKEEKDLNSKLNYLYSQAARMCKNPIITLRNWYNTNTTVFKAGDLQKESPTFWKKSTIQRFSKISEIEFAAMKNRHIIHQFDNGSFVVKADQLKQCVPDGDFFLFDDRMHDKNKNYVALDKDSEKVIFVKASHCICNTEVRFGDV